MPSPDFATLIPELPRWNDGRGIDPQAWIECVGNYELAAGYSLIFWPRFTRFERYVLREDFSLSSLRGFERATANDRKAIEAVMNHIHLGDIHFNVEANESQIRYLGRILRDIHEVKLARDFPDSKFEVFFNDDAKVDLTTYELTFWQVTG